MSKLSDREIREHIRSVFSVLPEDMARAFCGGAIDEFERGVQVFHLEMPTISWDLNGSINEIAITNLADLSTRALNRRQLTPEMTRLVDDIEGYEPVPGKIALAGAGDYLVWHVQAARRLSALVTLIIPVALFNVIVDMSNRTLRLTAAEKRIIFDLLGGRSVRQSAEAANVSFETRRVQLKSACAKLDCSGQTDVIRLLLGQLAPLAQIVGQGSGIESPASRFVREHLPDDVRLFLKPHSHKGDLRWLELGASDGTPVVLVHGVMLPLLLKAAGTALDLRNVRLIMPIRRGYLEPIDARSLYDTGALVRECVDDLAEIVRHVSAEPVRIIGHSFGCIVALDFAQNHPDLVSRLDLFSINLGKPEETNVGFIGRMFAGLHKLSNTPGVFRVIAAYYRRAYADEKTVLRVLSKMFASSRDDLAYIRDAARHNRFVSWFSDIYQNSILGICEDVHHAVHVRDDTYTIGCPLIFHHGDEDGLSSIDSVRKLAENISTASVKALNGGHLLCGTIPPERFAQALQLPAAVRGQAHTRASA